MSEATSVPPEASPAAGSAPGTAGVTEAQVVAWLAAHPDALLRHPELLESLSVSHASGGAVSLIERQVEQLRGKNARLEDRLAQFTQNARDNEARAMSVHKLARTLIRAPSLAATLAGLRSVMREDFRIDDAAIGVNAGVYKRHDIEGFLPLEPEGALFKAMENFLRTRLLECGPISKERAQLVFPRTPGIASAAIVPLEKEKNLGFVALGSRDPERFQPRQGRLFLDMTAELLSAALRARLG